MGISFATLWFPDVEMFKADYGLEADTKFKTASVTEIEEYFIREEARFEDFQKEIVNIIPDKFRLCLNYDPEKRPNIDKIINLF